MPWKEFVVDNHMYTIGKSQKKDKALIMIFETQYVKVRITARHHDGHFKYYMDCEQADVYESWFAVPTVESRKSAKLKAINLLKRSLSNDVRAIVDLNTAEKELDQKAA